MEESRKKILITDDSEINRILLQDMLEEEYDVLEAEDGVAAMEIIEEQKDDIDLLLLDCAMPNKDGFQVLNELGEMDAHIPVIMISAENDQAFMVRAYKLGAIDYISRPFNAVIVEHKVSSVIRMHTKKQRIADVTSSHIMDKYQNNYLIVNVLSSIVEFRDGENMYHILHVQKIADMFAKELMRITDEYDITEKDLEMLPVGAAMHDIGKIFIPYEVLNKAGKYTDEEYNLMKKHTIVGYEILNSLEDYKDDPLIKFVAMVCKNHHERWDGSGYPEGLKGDETPIMAQIVAIADVYDTLISKRVYKEPVSHEEAVKQIKEGKLGGFNPKLIECLENIKEDLPKELGDISSEKMYEADIHKMIENIIKSI